MKTVEIFFDYICPFCYRSFSELQELYIKFPELEVSFNPCEIHQRPENHGKHSDLCIQGMFIAKEAGVDLWAYNRMIFDAYFLDHTDIEDIHKLANVVKDLIDPDLFIKSLESGRYKALLQQANDYAFTTNELTVVPHYKSGEHELASVEAIGIHKDQLETFLNTIFSK